MTPEDESEIGEITGLLAELPASAGPDRKDLLNRLMPIIYGRLKALARSNRYRWRGLQTPGTTSLVHEAYLRLADHPAASYESSRQFFCVASKAMRSILIDNARWYQSAKRGGGHKPVTLQEQSLVSAERCEELLALDQALGRLDEREPRLARIVECRCFGGLTVEETAHALDLSRATVKRGWSLACAWLFRELQM